MREAKKNSGSIFFEINILQNVYHYVKVSKKYPQLSIRMVDSNAEGILKVSHLYFLICQFIYLLSRVHHIGYHGVIFHQFHYPEPLISSAPVSSNMRVEKERNVAIHFNTIMVMNMTRMVLK